MRIILSFLSFCEFLKNKSEKHNTVLKQNRYICRKLKHKKQTTYEEEYPFDNLFIGYCLCMGPTPLRHEQTET